jgi:hypothetical protein
MIAIRASYSHRNAYVPLDHTIINRKVLQLKLKTLLLLVASIPLDHPSDIHFLRSFLFSTSGDLIS